MASTAHDLTDAGTWLDSTTGRTAKQAAEPICRCCSASSHVLAKIYEYLPLAGRFRRQLRANCILQVLQLDVASFSISTSPTSASIDTTYHNKPNLMPDRSLKLAFFLDQLVGLTVFGPLSGMSSIFPMWSKVAGTDKHVRYKWSPRRVLVCET